MAKNPLIRSYPQRVSKPLPNKSAGILDDYAVRKVVATKEGSIIRTPTDDIDIVNKKYVDDEIDAKISDGTAQGQLAFWDAALGKWVETEITELFWSDVNKRLGIGTDNPQNALHIKAAIAKLRLEDSDGAATIYGTIQCNHQGDIFIEADPGNAAGNTQIILKADGNEIMRLDGTTKRVGIGTISSSLIFSVSEKSGHTPIGGFAIKLTNKTGANSVAGKLVKADTATDDAVILAAAGDTECFGVFLDDGISDGSEAWVVVSGIADVMFDDNVTAVRGNWVATGVAAGLARTSASPAAAPQHFEEIGHCIESVAAGGGGTFIKARCVIHFN